MFHILSKCILVSAQESGRFALIQKLDSCMLMAFPVIGHKVYGGLILGIAKSSSTPCSCIPVFFSSDSCLCEQVVNFLLRGWIQYLESRGSIALPLLDTPQSVRDDFAWDLEFIREGSRKSTRVKFLMPSFSIWNRLISRFKSGFENCGTDSQ